MSLIDGLLGQLTRNVDVAGIAAQVGIDPAMAEKAIAVLGAAHSRPEDTVGLAAAQTGLDAGVLNQIVGQLGGEAALGQIAGMLTTNPQLAGLAQMLDRDGDGNPIDDIMGMAKGFLGGN